jgi:hypothetical protein
MASRGMTVRGVFLLSRLTHRRNGGTRSAVQFSPMNSTPTPTLALGLDTFGDVTVDADGRLLSQAQVVRDVIAEGRGPNRTGLRGGDGRPEGVQLCD